MKDVFWVQFSNWRLNQETLYWRDDFREATTEQTDFPGGINQNISMLASAIAGESRVGNN